MQERPQSIDLFRRLKGYRRIFSRFGKPDLMFVGFINFVLVADGLRVYQRVLVGWVHLDGRSAILNTELIVDVECPAAVADALAALGREPWHTMYRVTLAADGQALQWQDTDADGRVEFLVEEPGNSAWH